MKKRIFIGCSSSNDIPEKYRDDCRHLLEELFKKENDLVFGASANGLMGLSYNVALNNKREIIAICPKAYQKDLDDIECIEILTNNISERTDKLIELCDTLLFLPGGIGTIYELFTAIESKRNNEYDKPIIIYNCHNYYDEWLKVMDKIYEEKFSKTSDKNSYVVVDSKEKVLDIINNN